MTARLKLPWIVNLGLAGCLVWLLANHRPHGNENSAPAANPAPQASVAPAPGSAPSQDPEPFHWSQLESAKDYRVYVANLRASGCPEVTVRDIVSGDTHRAFCRKRAELNLDGGETGPWSRESEAQMVAYLLGEAAARNASLPVRRSKPESPPSYPLVLREIDPAELGLNESQQKVIAQLREDFISQVGGTNQDPGDPAYLQRWRQAQPESDGLMKSLLGTTVFENYQLAADGK